RLEFTDGDKNLMVLQQHPGSFAVLIIRDEKMICETSETFVAFVCKHRELVAEFVLPSLARVGIRPMLPLESPEVCSAALESLTATTNAGADSNQKAYEQFLKQVTGFLQSNRLLSDHGKKLAEQTQQNQLARNTVVAFDLLNDPEYVVSLLQIARASELP